MPEGCLMSHVAVKKPYYAKIFYMGFRCVSVKY